MSYEPVKSDRISDGDEHILAKGESLNESERPSSEYGDRVSSETRETLTRAEQDLAEEVELLNGDQRVSLPKPASSRWRTCREIALFTWALLATAAIVVLAVLYEKHLLQPIFEPIKLPDESQSTVHCPPFPSLAAIMPPSESVPSHPFPAAFSPTGKRNLVFMISDGMGPSSLALARHFKQRQEGPPWIDSLKMDKFLIGTSRTRSSSSLITDSAAGATAFSCGKKTYNGGIAVLPNGEPCGSVLEAAKNAGYMTGLVVTTRITDATPAVWASHVHSRHEEDIIASQLIGDGPLGHLVDVMLGGGLCHFLPKGEEYSCRHDDLDLVNRAKEKGYSWLMDRNDFDNLTAQAKIDLPLLGLFAEDDLPYELDQVRSQESFPSLKEMTMLALRALSDATRHSDNGFFLMVEGSRIDHAGHAQDPAAHAQEILAYDEAFAAAVDFISEDDVTGLVVSTSDHETGGLATAKQLDPDVYPEYEWFPSQLQKVIKSAEYMSAEYLWYLDEEAGDDANMTVYLQSKLSKCFGIDDASNAELNQLLDDPDNSLYMFARMINRRSQVGFTTHGHSGADVNIYASNPQKASFLTGNVDNTDIGRFLEAYLGVEVARITARLNQANNTINGQHWLGPKPEKDLSYEAHSHYSGNFSLRRRGFRKFNHKVDWASSGWC